MEKENGKAVIVIVSDMHINSTVALAVPVINLDEGGTYHATRTQHWLWECWQDFWGVMERDYPLGAWRRILIINGDMGELDTKRRSVQLITPNKAVIQRIVTETIQPAVEWAWGMYVVRGTPAHVGKSAWLEEAIAADLDNVIKDEARGSASWWHIRSVCEGVRLDVAHHASMGRNPWGRGNSANALASRMVWQYVVERKQPAPDLAIRSHNHVCVSGRAKDTEVWYTPAWTTLTEFGYRAGFENELSEIGGLMVECEGGKYHITKKVYQPKDARKIWAVRM